MIHLFVEILVVKLQIVLFKLLEHFRLFPLAHFYGRELRDAGHVRLGSLVEERELRGVLLSGLGQEPRGESSSHDEVEADREDEEGEDD